MVGHPSFLGWLDTDTALLPNPSLSGRRSFSIGWSTEREDILVTVKPTYSL